MSTTTRYYKSTDSGAPVLTGQTGSVLNVINLCLFGVSGVAYGSGGSAKAAAGWTVPFTNTSTKGVFQNKVAAGATGKYVRILDDGSLASGFKEATMTCYDTMSDINTGTNPTPTTTVAANGIIIRKSTTADSTARAWWLAADEKGFVLCIIANPSIAGENSLTYAGDCDTEITSDTYNFLVMGRTGVNTASANQAFSAVINYTATGSAWIMRSYLQTGLSIVCGLMGFGVNSLFGAGSSSLADPAIGTNNRYITPVFVTGETNLRGRMRGLLNCLNNIAATITTPTELTSIPGRPTGSIILVFPFSTTGGTAAPCIEVGASWDNP